MGNMAVAGRGVGQRIVAWVVGTRSTNTCRPLWATLPARNHRHC
jgi:IS1 family transposase